MIIAGDFNMDPSEWSEDTLDKMNFDIIKPNTTHTCRTTADGGTSFLDYLLVSRGIAPMVHNVSTIGGDDGQPVPWSPHVGISFEVHATAETTWHQAQIRPKNIPLDKDVKDKYIKWDIDQQEWNHLYQEAEEEANKHIKSKDYANSDQSKHVERMGLKEIADLHGKLYTQWSIAAERAQAKATAGEIRRVQQGRGRMPKFTWKNEYDKSSDKVIQHARWEMQNKHAISGADLYRTLWGSIAGALRRMAGEARRDEQAGNHDLSIKGYSRDRDFFEYIVTPPEAR